MAKIARPPTTGILVVRAWREDGSFRATVSASHDVVGRSGPERRMAASPDEVLSIVTDWLLAI